MQRRISLLGSILLVLFFLPEPALAQEFKIIPLVKPQMDSGRLLMHVLKDRKSSREFSNRKLPIRVISNLLWSAAGINRPESGKRTAPSARNWQEIDIYVATAKGLYLYDPRKHQLQPVLAQDIRALTGSQAYVREAPLNLIYVADYNRMENASSEVKDLYSAVDAGFIGQNVYLYCASEGLATVARGTVDRTALAQAMKLKPEQRIIFAQSVGYPKK
ncbi:MAG: SagB/ThcOx family dehydrogenase [Syntrophobacterales bacterium]|nr:SagB/ThcOx family dehydrogenase [Syntrophobacterales bacterium]